MPHIAVTEEVVAGSSPSELDDLRAFADQGYQSVFSLRPGDAGGKLPTQEEGKAVRENGMTFLNYPIAADDLHEFQLFAFQTKLKMLPKPLYLHADDWQKAVAFALVGVALVEDWTQEQTLAHAAELDGDCDTDPVREFVNKYVS